jgi:tripartite-type tricarboxylate transporter receptor subunit TctC
MGRAKSPHGEGAMKPTRWLTAGLLALCAVAGGMDRPAHAQNYPARPVKLVVPYPPAGTADIVARLLAEQIGRTGGPAIVIENRPGGGTAI